MKMKNVEWIASPGKDKDYFVGIKIKNNKIEFHYPENYVLSDEENRRKDVLSILRTLSLSGKLSNNPNELNNKNNDKFDFPLNSYLWLINDYLEYHRYDNREKVIRHGQQGRINWNKTLHQMPMVSDGNFIYNDLISERKNQIDNMITQIYLYCVNLSVRDAGWMFNLPYNEYEFGKMNVTEDRKRTFIAVLRNEMAHTFDDQKRLRLSHMLNVLKGLDDNLITQKTIVKGVEKYDHVFEAMVEEMFSQVDNKKDFFPEAKWDLVHIGSKDTNKLRPDTIIVNKDEKKIFILDSKYYRFGHTFDPNDLPEVSSIEKQITYGEFAIKLMKNKGEDYEVYNAFVIPFNKGANPNQTEEAAFIKQYVYVNDNVSSRGNLAFAGTSWAKWPSDPNLKHRKIATILIDLNYLIDNWNRRNKDNIDEMVSLIEKKMGGA